MKLSILIVEDEKIVREGLARALSPSYKTYQAFNGRVAIEVLNKNSDIEIVISDLKMPEVDGIEMLDRIQADNIKVDVIFITAFYSVESATEAMRKGAFDYLTKPVDLEKLESTIKRAIALRNSDDKI